MGDSQLGLESPGAARIHGGRLLVLMRASARGVSGSSRASCYVHSSDTVGC